MLWRRASRVAVAFLPLLIVTLMVSGCAPAASASQASVTDQTRTITVVGTGKVQAKPDVAHLNVGVDVTAATTTEAVEKAQVKMTAVLAALKAAGIPDKDIQTSHYSINFERTQQDAGPTTAGSKPAAPGGEGELEGFYRVSNMVDVTVRDLDKVGDALDATVKAGANNVWGVSFSLDDTSTPEVQAREKAVADAKARAESLAKLNGVGVGEVLAISEVIGNTPAPVFLKEAASMAYGGGGGAVEPGELTFTTMVQVTYGIR